MNINRSDGWVKLHKKLLYSSLWDDPKACHTFLTLLLMAHHEENFASVRFHGKQVYLKPGQLVISRTEIADFLHTPVSTMKNVLKRLRDTQRITQQTDNHITITTICNWEKYQAKDVQPITQPKDNNMSNHKSNPPLVKRIKNKEVKTSTKVLATPAVYGNPDINEVVEHFQQTLNLKLNRVKAQRQAASNLIKRYTLPVVLRAIEAVAACRDDEYAPRILSIQDLWDKWNNLEAYYRKMQANKKGKVVVINDA